MNIPSKRIFAAAILAAGATLVAPHGAQAADVTYGELLGVFSSTGPVRLDIGTRAMQENTGGGLANAHTIFRIYKLNDDGSPDRTHFGPVSTDDVIGIFSRDLECRLDIGVWAMKENVPSDHKSWATQLYIGDPLFDRQGATVLYGVNIGVFSSAGPGGGQQSYTQRLNVAPPATKNCNNDPQSKGSCTPQGCVSASHASWATMLNIKKAAN